MRNDDQTRKMTGVSFLYFTHHKCASSENLAIVILLLLLLLLVLGLLRLRSYFEFE
jgi:hypothetical protein